MWEKQNTRDEHTPESEPKSVLYFGWFRLVNCASPCVPPIKLNMHSLICVAKGSHNFQAVLPAAPDVPALPGSDTSVSLTCLHHFWALQACQKQCLTLLRSGTSVPGGKGFASHDIRSAMGSAQTSSV